MGRVVLTKHQSRVTRHCADAPCDERFTRYWFQVPDDSERLQHLQPVEREIDFPPVEALACRGRIVMVVVVPALAEGEQRQPEIVAAVIGGCETTFTEA